MAEKETYVPEASFTSLVLTLSSSAWISLGKVTDPVSGEIKQDLKGAKYTIDLLIMLREKTSGNLTGDEEKLLNALLGDLQANYAEMVFTKKEPEGAEKPSEAQAEAGHKSTAEKESEAAAKQAAPQEGTEKSASSKKGNKESQKKDKDK